MIPTRGFTLLETLVAITVLLMALTGPFAIAQQSLKSSYYARDQVTAFYLAQEGIEYVRAMRDGNYLTSAPWLTSLAACVTPAVCTVDFANFTSPAVCPNGICPALFASTASGLFNQVNGTASKFTRTMTLTEVIGQPDQMILSVTIAWKSAGVSRTFTLKERIFNWL